MLLGVVSDTHGLVRDEIHRVFAGVDAILHAGDIGDEDVLHELAAIAPVLAVAGNVDGFSLGQAGLFARATLGGTRFLITHVLDRPRALRPEVAQELAREPAEVVIFGHSHLPHDERVGGVWFFNPASAGPRRFDYPVSVGLFEEHGGVWTARHVGLDPESERTLAQGLYLNQLSREPEQRSRK
jgi:putative phosphoesterase